MLTGVLYGMMSAVLDSITQLSPPALFNRPLLSDQSFPRLYLWVIQQFSRPFADDVLALRFFPFLAMLAAFFVWINISRRVLQSAGERLIFIFCWAASMPLVYYAAELKQYSMDVLAAGLIVLFLLDQHKLQQNPKLYRCLLLFLPLLGLCSYPALFLLWLPLYNLLRDCFTQRRWQIELTCFLSSYLLVLALDYYFDFRASVPSLLETFWHDYFISFDSLKHFLNSFGKAINNLISRRFAENPKWVKIPSRIFIGFGLIYMLAASWGPFKKDGFWLRSTAPICLSLFLIQLMLAALRVYPFGVPRMSLFFSPLLLLMTITALRFLKERFRPLILFQVVFIGYLVFLSLGIAWNVFLKRDLGAESRLFEPIGRGGAEK